MIEKILSRKEFLDRPPVLIDVGASGEIHEKWRPIAKYCTCLAFDADNREMSFQENTNSGFRKLITINRIVSDKDSSETDFYLTASPFCSSTLEPDLDALAQWPFRDLFRVDKVVKLKCVKLMDAMSNAGVAYVDWLKIDTQGTDLRIFKSLPDNVRKSIITAEFEPGIIDAYKGEDKLFRLIEFMTDSPFFMSSMDVKGVQRVNYKVMAAYSPSKQRSVKATHRISPCWAEVCYMNRLATYTDTRSLLLGWVFAIIEKQYGFAAELARKGFDASRDPIFREMEAHAEGIIQRKRMTWPLRFVQKKANRLIDMLFA